MDTSRTHEVTHAQFPWSWVLVGAVAMILVAGLIALQGNGDDIAVRTHVDEIPLGTPTTFDGVRETPISVPALEGNSSSTFTGIREGGEYNTAAQDPTPGPAPGR